MIYPYRCTNEHCWEVIKSVRDIDNPEPCPECDTMGTRTISQSQSFSGADDWDTAHYSQALGKVVRNNGEERRQARAKGLTEVGTESPEKTHKHFKDQRDKKHKDGWDSVNMDLGEMKFHGQMSQSEKAMRIAGMERKSSGFEEALNVLSLGIL